MLKYLLVIPATLIGVFLGALLAASITRDGGTLTVAFAAGCGIGAGRLVYGYFKKREVQARVHTEGPAILSTDVNNFRKVFQQLDCVAYGITEVKFLERADQVSFSVGIRSIDNTKVDYDVITKALYKLYYKHIKFEFIDLASEQGRFLIEKGIEVPVKKTQS